MTQPLTPNPVLQPLPGTPPMAPAVQTAVQVDRYARMIFSIGDRFFEVSMDRVSTSREAWTQVKALLSASLPYHYGKYDIPKTFALSLAKTNAETEERLLIGDESGKVEPLRSQYSNQVTQVLNALKTHRADPAAPQRTLMLTDPAPQLPPAQWPQPTPQAPQHPQGPNKGADSDSDPGAGAGVPTTRRKKTSNEEDSHITEADDSPNPDAPRARAAAAPAVDVATPSMGQKLEEIRRKRYRRGLGRRRVQSPRVPMAAAQPPAEASPFPGNRGILAPAQATIHPRAKVFPSGLVIEEVRPGEESDAHQYDNPLEEDASSRTDAFLTASDGDDSLDRAPDLVD